MKVGIGEDIIQLGMTHGVIPIIPMDQLIILTTIIAMEDIVMMDTMDLVDMIVMMGAMMEVMMEEVGDVMEEDVEEGMVEMIDLEKLSIFEFFYKGLILFLGEFFRIF